MNYQTDINYNENETYDEYINRLLTMKYTGMLPSEYTWTTIADIIADVTGRQRDESTWRKQAKNMFIDIVDDSSAEKDKIDELMLALKKERVKLSDERIQNNAYIRRLSREETIKEIAYNYAKELSAKKILPIRHFIDSSDSECEAIVQISDWHYGIEIDNVFNKFDKSVCVSRVSALLNECKNYFTKNPVKKIYVVNLGDLIAGRIHQTLRYQSRVDVITQIMDTTEILVEFLHELSELAPIEYYDCLDNHSRLEPVKSDSLDLESLARITPWHLDMRFKDDNRITISHSCIDDEIISFKALDGKWTIGGVHGHKDKPTKVVDNLTTMFKVTFDLILTAHLHHFSCDEKNEVPVVSNGSLMGTDSYAYGLRLTSKPSQNIIIMNDKSPMDIIHRVVL